MSELGNVYKEIKDGFEKLHTKIDTNYKEFTDRMSTNELKIALLENGFDPKEEYYKALDFLESTGDPIDKAIKEYYEQ